MKIRESFGLKLLAFVLAVLLFAVGAAMTVYQTVNVQVLWGEESLLRGYANLQLCRWAREDIEMLIAYSELENPGTNAKWQLRELTEALDAEHTNLRWQVSRGDTIFYGNTREPRPEQQQPQEYTMVLDDTPWSATQIAQLWETSEETLRAEDWQEKLAEDAARYENGDTTVEADRVYTDEAGWTDVLIVDSGSGQRSYAPTVRAVLEANADGFCYDLQAGWLKADSGQTAGKGTLTMWLAEDLPVEDEFRSACATLTAWKEHRVAALVATAGCFLAGVVLTVWLCVASGHKKNREGIFLCWFHRIPGDLLLAAYVIGGVLLGIGIVAPFEVYLRLDFRLQLVASALCAAGLASLIVSWLVTVSARCKGHTLLRSTVIGGICIRLWHGGSAVMAAVPLVWKTALVCAGYGLFGVILVDNRWNTGFWAFAWALITAALALYLCWWAYQWKRLRQGAREIIRGNRDYRIDSSKMPPDMRKHAGELNNLGQAIGAAVEERMRSEHFKAELITNVSHDLKTPLTSIINYVDLLKKENLDDPKVQEYLEVLDRKSQRLKKLTEDLVEASKASTGVLSVQCERLDLIQLADQALAEYEDRLTRQELTVVRTVPSQPVWVKADGRHLWRVLDNLLSNCAKYALEGTRVYVEVQGFRDCAKLLVKNISRDELNIPAEQLTERFVRGDESRTMEGSGLGLSIAQSLTELQQGSFEIAVDGDLFKATVTLPLAE